MDKSIRLFEKIITVRRTKISRKKVEVLYKLKKHLKKVILCRILFNQKGICHSRSLAVSLNRKSPSMGERSRANLKKTPKLCLIVIAKTKLKGMKIEKKKK